ncbi:UNVERIFIED_CONTAM: hypothetical protein O1L33_06960, partial [Pseudomonas aeruginosa]
QAPCSSALAGACPKSALSAACATCDDLRPSKRPNAQGCEKCGLANPQALELYRDLAELRD